MAAAIHLNARGSGPAVVLLHSCPGRASYFDPIVEALAPRHLTLTADLPGYGTSPRLKTPYSLERAIELLAEALRGAGVERCAVVGHGLGTYRALQLALSGAVQVDRIVGLGGFASLGGPYRVALRRIADLWEKTSFDFMPLWQHNVFEPGWLLAHPDEAAPMLDWLRDTPRDLLGQETRAAANSEDLTHQLALLEIPIYLRWGARDLATPLSWGHQIERMAPRATLEEVVGRGHYLLLDDHAATVEAVSRFLGPAAAESPFRGTS